MTPALAIPGNTASTFLTHFFGTGLSDERYVVERFRTFANGDIRPWSGEVPGKGRRAKRVTATLKAVKEMRPARTEIIVCTGAAHPGRDAGLGRPRNLDVPRPQMQGLSGALPGRPAGHPTAGRPRSGISLRYGERPMCEQDIKRARDLERYHRRVAERRAKGLCLKCGKRPPAPHRSQCAVCIEKRRPADLARYHQRTAERVALGLCPKCGKHPPEPGRSQCGGCAEKDRAAGRARCCFADYLIIDLPDNFARWVRGFPTVFRGRRKMGRLVGCRTGVGAVQAAARRHR